MYEGYTSWHKHQVYLKKNITMQSTEMPNNVCQVGVFFFQRFQREREFEYIAWNQPMNYKFYCSNLRCTISRGLQTIKKILTPHQGLETELLDIKYLAGRLCLVDIAIIFWSEKLIILKIIIFIIIEINTN